MGRGGVGLGMALAVGAVNASDEEDDDLAMLVLMGAPLPICSGTPSMGARLPISCDGSLISIQAAPMSAPGQESKSVSEANFKYIINRYKCN